MSKKYCDHVLASTAAGVLDAMRDHPGEMDKRPVGFDVGTGMSFTVSRDGSVQELGDGTIRDYTPNEEDELIQSLASGAVEVYLQRPFAFRESRNQADTVLLHAAIGRTIPIDSKESE